MSSSDLFGFSIIRNNCFIYLLLIKLLELLAVLIHVVRLNTFENFQKNL